MTKKFKTELTCEDAVQLLTLQQATGSEAAAKSALHRHLEACPRCREQERRLREAIRFFGTKAELEVPETIQKRIEEALAQQPLEE